MPHDHASTHHASTRRLALTLVLSVTYLLVEVVGGVVSGSLALLADAGIPGLTVAPSAGEAVRLAVAGAAAPAGPDARREG